MRWVAKIPKWVSHVAGALAAGMLFAVSILARILPTTTLGVLAGVGFLAAVIGFVVPLLRQHQERLAARLMVDVQISGPVEGLPQIDMTDAVEAWLAAERAACLSSLPPPVMEPEAPDVGGDTEEEVGIEPKRISLKELKRIEAKRSAGEELTPEEKRAQATAGKVWDTLLQQFAGFNYVLSAVAADDRTPDQYKAEIEAHLAACRKVLDAEIRRQYVLNGLGRVVVSLSTSKEKTYEKVELVLHIEGPASAQVRERRPKGARLPSRPRPFGQAPAPLPSIVPYSPRFQPPPPLPLPETVDVEEGPPLSITYPSVTVRPGKVIPLPDVFLLTTAKPGVEILGTWSVTSTSAEGRPTGSFKVKVVPPAIPADTLFNDALASLRAAE